MVTSANVSFLPRPPIEERLLAGDWPRIGRDLEDHGHAVIERLLAAPECSALAARYDAADLYRSRVVMARHAFGRGEYQYFAYPLPHLVRELRTASYRHLAPVANRWHETLGLAARFPDEHVAYLE